MRIVHLKNYENLALIANMNMITLEPIVYSPEYIKKWNQYAGTEFVQIYSNGVLLNDNVYCTNFYWSDKTLQEDSVYFQLVKVVEAYYADNITEDPIKKPHLAKYQCIINSEGVETYVHYRSSSEHLYLNKCIYHIGSKYFSARTNELICESYTKLESEDYLFLDNAYDTDTSRRGIIQACKRTGEILAIFNKK